MPEGTTAMAVRTLSPSRSKSANISSSSKDQTLLMRTTKYVSTARVATVPPITAPFLPNSKYAPQLNAKIAP